MNRFINLNYLNLFAAIFVFVLSFVGCKNENDDNNNSNEQELITTLQLVFTNALDNSNTYSFAFRDTDGDGGLSPIADTISLSANQSYFMEARFLDESKTPVVDFTGEINEEATEHQVFYTVNGTSSNFGYNDVDDNGLPIGLNMFVATDEIAIGTLTVTLKHQPDGLKNNTINVGDTDVQATFVLKIN